MTSKLLEAFIKNVDLLLAKHGKTRADLAREMDIRPQSLHQQLSGEHMPGLDKVERIAACLRVTAAELLKVEDDLRTRIHALVDQMDEAELTTLISTFAPAASKAQKKSG